jgi:hypothetical protein
MIEPPSRQENQTISGLFDKIIMHNLKIIRSQIGNDTVGELM